MAKKLIFFLQRPVRENVVAHGVGIGIGIFCEVGKLLIGLEPVSQALPKFLLRGVALSPLGKILKELHVIESSRWILECIAAVDVGRWNAGVLSVDVSKHLFNY